MSYFEKMRQPNLKQVLRFISLRFARIYPVHLFTLLGLLAAAWNSGWPKPSNLSQSLFVENLFLVQSWTPNSIFSWNYPAWSISSEWFVYCMCPLVFIALHKLKSQSARLIALLICIIGTGLTKYIAIYPLPMIFPIIPAFVGGILLSCIFPPTSWNHPNPKLVFISAGPLFLTPYLTENRIVIGFSYAVVFFFIVASLGSGVFKRLPILLSPPLIYIGEISYSLYLTQVPTLTAIPGVFGDHWLTDIQHQSFGIRAAVLGGYLAVVFTVAIFTHHLIEKPSRNWLRNWIPRMIPG